MTVCIAAICVYPRPGDGKLLQYVVGAADKMLTAGDIEYEPDTSKVFKIAERCVLMIAGDTAAQTTLLYRTLAHLRETPETRSIAQIAEAYSRLFVSYRAERAEAEILKPMGLDLATFWRRQRSLSDDVTRRVLEYDLDCESIIAGIDQGRDMSAGHIYVISDAGHAQCFDMPGFAAIGIGSEHAESQFMFEAYTPRIPLPQAVLMTYAAKRHSEVAPGVGEKYTDLFSIAPGPMGLVMLGDTDKKDLLAFYEEGQAGISKIKAMTYEKMNDLVRRKLDAELSRRSQQQSAQTPSTPQGTDESAT